MNYKYHNELKKLSDAYPLTDAERKELKKLLIDKGQILPILIWDGYVVDGHNRLELLNELNIEPFYKEVAFESLDDAKMFIINNYLGQRNLTDGQKWELAQDKKEILLEKGRENLKHGGLDKKGLSIVDKGLDKHNTRDEIAKDLGWSTGKVAMADKVWREAKPEIKEKIKAGEVSINQAYNDIKKEKKKKDLEKKKKEYVESSKKEIVNKPTIKITDAVSFLNEFEDNTIDLLITDPPYMTDVDDIGSFTSDWLTLAIQKIKENGRGYICSGAYPEEIQAFLSVLLNQNKFTVDCPLVWTYRNTLGVTPKMKYNLNYQLIWHLYSADSDELDTSITNEMFSVQDINAPDGRLGNRLHKWQKPDELARRLIRHSTKEDDLIVDCFACTGTFLIEGARMNRRATGCDISIENAKIAEERGCIIIGNKT